MENISIRGYDIILPNSTWGKKGEPIRKFSASKESVFVSEAPTTEFYQISRYTMPFREETIARLQERAKKFLSEESSEVSHIFAGYAANQIKEIADGNGAVFNHVLEHISENEVGVPRHKYIHLMRGVVLDELLKNGESFLKTAGHDGYEIVIGCRGYNKKCMTISLEKDELPLISKMEYLLQEGVKECNSFAVSGNFKDVDEIHEEFKRLYAVLNYGKNIEKLWDRKEAFIESSICIALEDSLNCLSKKGIVVIGKGGIDSEEASPTLN